MADMIYYSVVCPMAARRYFASWILLITGIAAANLALGSAALESFDVAMRGKRLYELNELQLTSVEPFDGALDTALARDTFSDPDFQPRGLADVMPEQSLIRRQSFDSRQNLLFAADLNQLGSNYNHESKYLDAKPILERSLAIREQQLPPMSVAIADTLENLAVVYRHTGMLRKAEQASQRALDILKKTLGPDDPAVAIALGNLARTYQTSGDNEKAEDLDKDALHIQEKAVDSNDHDPEIARSLYHLAIDYKNQWDLSMAISTLERAAPIAEKSLGKDDPLTGLIKSDVVPLEMLKTLLTYGTYAIAYLALVVLVKIIKRWKNRLFT